MSQKLVTNPLFEWEFSVVQQDYEQVKFYKNSRLYILGRSLRDGKVTNYVQLAHKGNPLTKICQSLVF